MQHLSEAQVTWWRTKLVDCAMYAYGELFHIESIVNRIESVGINNRIESVGINNRIESVGIVNRVRSAGITKRTDSVRIPKHAPEELFWKTIEVKREHIANFVAAHLECIDRVQQPEYSFEMFESYRATLCKIVISVQENAKHWYGQECGTPDFARMLPSCDSDDEYLYPQK